MTRVGSSASAHRRNLIWSLRAGTEPARALQVLRAMRSVVLIAATLACLALPGCLVQRGASVQGVAPISAAKGPVTFEAELRGPVSDSATRPPTGRITITFRDAEHYEYDMVVRDAGAATYIAAWIVPVGRTEPLAVLVSDVSLQGEFAQLRGTGVTAAAVAGPSLLERLRIRPADYEIRVPSMKGHEPLAGALGVK